LLLNYVHENLMIGLAVPLDPKWTHSVYSFPYGVPFDVCRGNSLPGPPPLVPAKVRPLAPVQQLETLAGHAFRSGMFKKFSSASGAYMVMAMGYELGLSPVAALTSIHSLDGKPVMSGNLMWSLVLAHPDWQESHVSQSPPRRRLSLPFVFRGKERGRVKWTAWRTPNAPGLLGKDNWRKFPRAMLFNRAISEGFQALHPAPCERRHGVHPRRTRGNHRRQRGHGGLSPNVGPGGYCHGCRRLPADGGARGGRELW
jgi:hypothetical protein